MLFINSLLSQEEYVSNGFVRQNHLLLEMLTGQSSDNSPKLSATSMFLPMVFPKLFGCMHPDYKKQFESVALGCYIKHAERMHAPFEKSPKDYITFMNARGFCFEKVGNRFELRSIYTNIN